MKTCASCQKTKSFDDFHKRSRAKDGYQSRCAECNRKQRSEYYRTAKGRESNRHSSMRIAEKNLRRLFEYLLTHPCIGCGNADPIVLEFDHRDPATKAFNLGDKLDCSWKKIEEEIEKCDVRCANCHRRKTAEQFDWRTVTWYDEHIKGVRTE